jgi:hypothetical protein
MARAVSRTCGSCRQRSERDDLRDFVFAVFIGDILHHFVAALVREVDVDVGSTHAIRVEEALEQQAIRQRVEVRDAQHVRN